MTDLIKRILDNLTGADYWIAFIVLAIGLGGWYLLGKAQKTEQRIAKRQILFAALMILLAISAITANHYLFNPKFPKDVAGILILRIEGDDEKNSLQRELVSSLNEALTKEAPNAKIEVRASTEIVTEAMGLEQAHAKARKIGKTWKAMLVVWGIRVGDKKFHPRLTIVEDQPRTIMAGDRTLSAQDLNEMSMPVELVSQPIFLTHFAAGYTYYDQQQYAQALSHFELALIQRTANPIELTDVCLYVGNSHSYLAREQSDKVEHLNTAIDYYKKVLGFYTEENFPKQWARTQNNLGIAYRDLPNGNRLENLNKAIKFSEAALCVFTENDFPYEWAWTQHCLGFAYHCIFLTNKLGENLKKAIAAYEAALRVFTENTFPEDQQMVKKNLQDAKNQLQALTKK